ncbi:hypothetical protein [Falsiroseomonas sp. E2-1-a20]|uniref:hypothetical protein n=1 Tax=Falsiroseomonas sp. E2-1-a20 TaxID=3239300 RepID=UPI003F2F3694
MTAPDVATDAFLVSVTYADASGLDAATLGNDDLNLLLNGVPTGTVSFTGFSAGAGVASYSITPAGTGWVTGDYTVVVAAGAVTDASSGANPVAETLAAPITLDFTPDPVARLGPDGDLDNDGTVNSADLDIDGDGTPNATDLFFYDAQNGRTLAVGETVRLDFNTNGTPFQNGFTGVMQGTTAVAGYQKETGAGRVEDGKLVVTTTLGDTGTSNNPQDDYQLGIRNASFTLEAVFDNPFLNTGEVANNFEQVGLQLSLNSDAFMKFVFGSPGAPGGGPGVEFSQDSGTQIKAAYPGGFTLTTFAKAKLELLVATAGATSTGTAVLTLLDAAGNVLPNGSVTVGTLPINAVLAAALQNAATAIGVGVTSSHFGGDEFIWKADYFQVREPTPPVTENTAPTLSGPATVSVAENATTVASFTAMDQDGDALTFGLTGPDQALFAISQAGVLSFVGAPDFEAPADVGGNNVYDVTVTVTDGVATASQQIAITVTDLDETQPGGGGLAPEEDLDADGAANNADPDIDGDGILNTTDVFYFDAQNGQVLADGQAVRLDFDTAGTPFQNGFTGVMQGTTGTAGYQKDTGAGYVAGGQLVVPTTSGDTGGTNNPQNDYHFGIKRGGGFTVETVIENPFGTEAKASFKQLGLAISLDSTDFVKFVTGNVGGNFEFSYRNNDAETKVNGNLPAGFKLFGTDAGTLVAKLKLVIEVNVNEAGNATAIATATMLDANSVPVTGVAPVTLNLDLVGDLEAALADPAQAVGIGVTHSNGSGTPFLAKFDYVEVKADGVALGGPSAITLSNATVNENQAGAIIGTVTVTEPDGDAVALSVGDQRFEIVGGQLKLKAGQALDFEAQTAISVAVTATDKDGSLTQDFVIGVQNDPADDPASDVLDIIGSAGGVTTTDTYATGTLGSAVLKILPGNNSIQTSNFGANSFQLENTGDKKIAAVFIDVRDALYPDMIFDDDGSGGDDVSKDFSFASGSDASALAPFGYEHFFLAARSGFNPLFAADKQDSGKGADGGWRGLLLKFGEAGDGFAKGDTAAFAGDMDPNSIAGLKKTTVDSFDVPNWDVGGTSGAELIGSRITVMFSDGTFAQGQLFGDTSQAGSQALITQAIDLDLAPVASLTINGIGDGGSGSYGGTPPSVVVSGPAGATVRVVMTKGFDPVGNTATVSNTTVDQLVTDRLDAYAFKANNAAEFQTLDIIVPASGSIDVGALFAYNNVPNGNSGVPDFAKLQLGFTAAVVNPASKLAIGPVSDPIYLANNGSAVVGGATTPPSGSPPAQAADGYFTPTVSGSNVTFKVQFEDANVLGQDPGGKWSFVDGVDANGYQTGFQGAGYYLWGSPSSIAINNPETNSFLPFEFVVPEGQAGNYTLRLRASRDPGQPSDQQNDVWVRMNENSSEYLVNQTPAVSSSGFVKLFGGPNTGTWGYANQIDSASDAQANFTAVFSLEAGVNTLTFAGRSQGYHLDFWELYKGNAPGVSAPNSTFVPEGPTVPVVADPIDDVTLVAGVGGTIQVPAGTFSDLDGDALTLSAAIPSVLVDGLTFNPATGVFTLVPGMAEGVYAISVSAADDDGNVATDSFALTIAAQPTGPSLTFQVIGTGGFVDTDLENGDSYTLSSLGSTPKFSGVLESGSAASVLIQLLNGSGSVIGSQVENLTPFDYTYSGSALVAGEYTLRATAFASTGAQGQTLGVQEFDFTVSGSGGNPTNPASISVTIANSAGDWEQSGGAGSQDLELGLNGSQTQYVGLRFTGLDIPEGAVIESAYFEFKALESNAAAASFQIAIENSETAVGYTTTNNPGTRSYLPETVAWQNVEAWTAGQIYRSADISGLIEDVIGSDGLETTEALGFLITGSGSRVANPFDLDGVGPRLVVNFEADNLL